MAKCGSIKGIIYAELDFGRVVSWKWGVKVNCSNERCLHCGCKIDIIYFLNLELNCESYKYVVLKKSVNWLH